MYIYVRLVQYFSLVKRSFISFRQRNQQTRISSLWEVGFGLIHFLYQKICTRWWIHFLYPLEPGFWKPEAFWYNFWYDKFCICSKLDTKSVFPFSKWVIAKTNAYLFIGAEVKVDGLGGKWMVQLGESWRSKAPKVDGQKRHKVDSPQKMKP